MKNTDIVDKDSQDTPQPVKKNLSRRRFVVLGSVALLVVAGSGSAFALSNMSKKDSSPDGQADSRGENDSIKGVSFNIAAEGWDSKASTPVIVRISSKGGTDDESLFHHAFNPNTDDGPIEISPEATTVKLSFISPINPDGSLYKIDEVNIDTPDVDQGILNIEKTAIHVTAENVSQTDLEEIIEAVSEAMKTGDGTLSGEAGTRILDMATTNASAAPGVDVDKISDKAEAGKAEIKESRASSGIQETSPTKPTDSSSEYGGSQTGGSPDTGSTPPAQNPGDSGGSQPHVHNWVPQRTTVHHDAVTSPIEESRCVCNTCGHILQPGETWAAHVKASGYTCQSYSSQLVVVGYETIQKAYDETVVTGYVCSICGATKGA